MTASQNQPSDTEGSPLSNTPPYFPETPDEKGLNKEQHGSHSLARAPSIAERLPLGREILFVAVVVLAQFTTQAGLGQTLSILHIIGHDFGITDPAQLSWLVAGYSLTVGSFILISGRLGDVFGWKRMFTIGFAWFSVWSIVAGLAVYSNHVLFIFARVLQGIGPAITLPNGLALLGSSYNPGPRKDMVSTCQDLELLCVPVLRYLTDEPLGLCHLWCNCSCWCSHREPVRCPLRSCMVAVGVLVLRDCSRFHCGTLLRGHSGPTKETGRYTNVAAREAYLSRSRWRNAGYDSVGAGQLCLQPSANRGLGSSLRLRMPSYRSDVRSSILLRRNETGLGPSDPFSRVLVRCQLMPWHHPSLELRDGLQEPLESRDKPKETRIPRNHRSSSRPLNSVVDDTNN